MKWVLRILGTLVVLVVIIVAAGYLFLKGSLPQADGEIYLAGLNDVVAITRDKNGVPHIRGKTLEDAVFALGFVHAQDRLWQMEMNRRIGAGRLSEILGSATINTDKFLRTLSVYEAVKKSIGGMKEETHSSLEHYTRGVNAFLDQHAPLLPPEFLILQTKPEPWTITDSVVWTKMMAWDLSKNWGTELQRFLLSKSLTNQQINEIFPAYPGDTLPDLPDFSKLFAAANIPAKSILAMAPETLPPGAGSNNWVVSGDLSKTGKPLLANDPHLGLAAPALWYFAYIEAPGKSVV